MNYNPPPRYSSPSNDLGRCSIGFEFASLYCNSAISSCNFAFFLLNLVISASSFGMLTAPHLNHASLPPNCCHVTLSRSSLTFAFSSAFECLEYIVVHEMVHLIEPTHNRRFVARMDHLIPKWQHFRDTLNYLPVRHERWQY